MKQYKIGLVIGRFQPFHLGHKYLIDKALELCDKIIIGIGSSNITDSKNPFNLKARANFLNEFISHTKIENRIEKIITIEDVPDDDEWLELILKKTGPVDVEIGDNEWSNGIFEKAGTPVVRVGYYKRNILEGTKIRRSMKLGKAWKNRVPEYLIDAIEKDR